MLIVLGTIAAFVAMYVALTRMGLTSSQFIVSFFVSMFGLILGPMGSAVVFWCMVMYYHGKNNPKVDDEEPPVPGAED